MVAYTRVEIVLVLLALAILVAAVIPRNLSRNYKDDHSDHSIALNALASIKTALDAFQVDTGHYPAGTNGLLDLLRNPAGTANWHGPYLDQIPKDPWGRDYQYACPGKHNPNAYDLWSFGPPDDATGPHEMIGNWSR